MDVCRIWQLSNLHSSLPIVRLHDIPGPFRRPATTLGCLASTLGLHIIYHISYIIYHMGLIRPRWLVVRCVLTAAGRCGLQCLCNPHATLQFNWFGGFSCSFRLMSAMGHRLQNGCLPALHGPGARTSLGGPVSPQGSNLPPIPTKRCAWGL